MEKVFVLSVDVVREYEPIENTIDVYKNEDKALLAFQNKVDDFREEDNDLELNVDDDTETSYERYENGYAAQCHTYIHVYTKYVKD